LRFLDDALFFALARPSFDTKFKSVVCFDIATGAGAVVDCWGVSRRAFTNYTNTNHSRPTGSGKPVKPV
jgi:hypothetical protein